MNLSYKKRRERLLLDEVAAILPDFPPGTIDNHESPDFLIRHNNQIVGIEVVDYIRGQCNNGSPQRRNESIWQKVANLAQVKYDEINKPNLLVHLLWNPGQHPSLSEVEKLAADVASLVSKNIPHKLFGHTRIDCSSFESMYLYKYVSSLHIMRVRNSKQRLWSFANSGHITLKIPELESLITSKNSKIDIYLNSCSEVWLIIVADGQQISSSIVPDTSILKHSFKSRFNRVLLYNRLNQQIVSLAIS